MASDKGNTKEKILDAAATVVLRDSAVGLTLEQVAKEAGVSKGGLLYHFPSKEALLRGIIETVIADFNSSTAERISKDPVEIGRFLRAYILEAAAPPEPGSSHEKRKRLQSALIAAMAIDHRLLDPLKEGYKVYQGFVENDGLDPVYATVIRLAADALWISSILGMPTVSEDMQVRALDRIIKLTYGKGDKNARNKD